MIVECPHCRRKSVVDVDLVEGQHVLCAYCGQKFDYHSVPEQKGTDEPAVVQFKVGQTVGAYRIIRCVGQGGMGAVYEVEHMTLGAHFAMKVFLCAADDVHAHLLRQKFLEEAKQLSAIKHANVAHVFDLSVDEATGVPYFVMDLVTYAGGEPCTLGDVDCAEIEEDLIFQWFSEMCRVLDYVHSLGVVHRDIKLENILLNHEQHVVLTDFGVAKVYEGLMKRAVQGGCKSGDISDENLIFGTAHYMAPEVGQGESATAAADVYSLGVAFVKLLTGMWYDEHPETIKRLVRRKYDWIPVLSAMLAPSARRPTKLSDLPRKMARQGVARQRKAGTWKIVLSDSKKKGKLYEAIERIKRQQEKRERQKNRLKWALRILVLEAIVISIGLVMKSKGIGIRHLGRMCQRSQMF